MTTENEKVIKGLECCALTGLCHDKGCPYIDSETCVDDLCNDALALIRGIPERPHGYWIDLFSTGDGTVARQCSVCGDWQTHYEKYIPNYCPHCGAKMD